MKNLRLTLACSGCVLVLFLFWIGCSRYSPQGLNRPYFQLGYSGKAPNELKADVLAASNIDAIGGPLSALSEIGLHYRDDPDEYWNALRCMEELLVSSNGEWGSRPTTTSFLTGEWYSDIAIDFFSKPPGTIGELTKAAVFAELSAIKRNYKGADDDRFKKACDELFKKYEPNEGTDLHTCWERWALGIFPKDRRL